MLTDIKTALSQGELARLQHERPESSPVLAFIRAELAEVTKNLRHRPGHHPEDWRKDAIWLMAQEELLRDLARLPEEAAEAVKR